MEAICRAVPIPLGALVLEGLFFGYNDFQEGFEGLWNTGLGVGRGIGYPYRSMPGACRVPARPHRSLPASVGPADRPDHPSIEDDLARE
jgi:hypothetical protein